LQKEKFNQHQAFMVFITLFLDAEYEITNRETYQQDNEAACVKMRNLCNRMSFVDMSVCLRVKTWTRITLSSCKPQS